MNEKEANNENMAYQGVNTKRSNHEKSASRSDSISLNISQPLSERSPGSVIQDQTMLGYFDPKKYRISDSGRIILRRKGNPHVSSACLNCRKSHLACDRSRPCTRCISSGKQDSCFDTKHKKRGRPKTQPSAGEDSVSGGLGYAIGEAAMASVYPAYNERHSEMPMFPNLKLGGNPSERKLFSTLYPTIEVKPDTPHPFNNKSSPHEEGIEAKGGPELNSLDLVLDSTTNVITSVTPCAYQFLGRIPGSLIGTSLLNWLHPKDKPLVTRNLSFLTNPIFIASNHSAQVQGPRYTKVTDRLSVHIQNGEGKYDLVEMILSTSLSGGLTCKVFKFGFDSLIRKTSPQHSTQRQ